MTRKEEDCGTLARGPCGFALRGLLLTMLFVSAVTGLKAQAPVDANRSVTLSERAFHHIVARHWPTSDAPAAGKFAFGITESALHTMIDEAVANGWMRPNTQGRPGAIIEYNFHRKIGTNLRGGPTSRLRVVVGPENQVITAFPY